MVIGGLICISGTGVERLVLAFEISSFIYGELHDYYYYYY